MGEKLLISILSRGIDYKLASYESSYYFKSDNRQGIALNSKEFNSF